MVALARPQQSQPTPGPQDLEESLRALLGRVERLYQDSAGAFKSRQPKLLENQAYYRGMQWGVPADAPFPTRAGLDDRERPEVINYVQPTVRSAAANKLRGGLPNPEVLSSTNDLRSRVRALNARRLMKSFLRNGIFEFETQYRAALSSEIDGIAFFKTIWNPMRGKRRQYRVIDPATSQALSGPNGEPLFDTQFEGDIEVQFVDATDCIPNPNARHGAEVRYVFHRKLLEIDHLNDLHPFDVFGRPTEGRWQGTTRTQSLYERDQVVDDGRSAGSISNRVAASRDNDLAELIEWWERPSNRFPEGRLLVWCGGVIVAYTDRLPYAWPWDPVYGGAVVPGSFYPEGTAAVCKPIQSSINLAAAVLREWCEFSSAGAWLNPNTSGIDDGFFENLTGGVLRYNQGAKPEHIAPGPPPQALFEQIDQLVSRMKDVSTYSDVTRGADPGQLSGRAMAYQEQFEHGVHAPDETLYRLTVVSVLTKCLYLARDFYDEGRLVPMVGESGRWAIKAFSATDYDFEAAIVIDPFSARPNSPALKFAETSDMAAAGILDDTPTGKRARHMLEIVTDESSTYDDGEADRERARSEAMGFLDDPIGAPLEVLPADDDDVHIDEHRTVRISPEYLGLPPEIRQRFEDHAAAHEQQHAVKLGLFSQQASAAGNPSVGMDGGPPPPSQPAAGSPLDGGHGPVGPPSAGPNEPPPPQIAPPAPPAHRL